MELDDWLHINRILIINAASAMDIPYAVLQYINKRAKRISLCNALKIHKYTNGEIALEDLLFGDEYDMVQKVKGFIPKKRGTNERKKYYKPDSESTNSESTSSNDIGNCASNF